MVLCVYSTVFDLTTLKMTSVIYRIGLFVFCLIIVLRIVKSGLVVTKHEDFCMISTCSRDLCKGGQHYCSTPLEGDRDFVSMS